MKRDYGFEKLNRERAPHDCGNSLMQNAER